MNYEMAISAKSLQIFIAAVFSVFVFVVDDQHKWVFFPAFFATEFSVFLYCLRKPTYHIGGCSFAQALMKYVGALTRAKTLFSALKRFSPGDNGVAQHTRAALSAGKTAIFCTAARNTYRKSVSASFTNNRTCGVFVTAFLAAIDLALFASVVVSWKFVRAHLTFVHECYLQEREV